MQKKYKNLFKPLKEKWTLAFFILFLGFSSYAQEIGQIIKVTGTVTDTSGAPLLGVNVIEEGSTSNGGTTDFDGNYNINVKKGSVLTFSYIGFLTQKVTIDTKSVVNIVMSEDSQKLDEIVVIGYGTQKRRDLTGSVSSVDVGDLNVAPVGSVDGALAGRISGVQVTSSQGRPGAPTSIKIRGTGSLTQSSDPLYVIDGFPIEDFDLSSIDQSDIGSFQILKGPSAVAIYGARGGNGVVLITTKDGTSGKTEVKYNGFIGYEKITTKIDVLSPYDFVDLRYEVDPDEAANRYGPLSAYQRPDGSSIEGIDWQEEAYRETEVQSHSLSVTGGSKETKYNLSLSKYDGEGLLENSAFNRTYAKVKLNQKISDKLKVGVNISYTTSRISGTSTSSNILNPDTDGGSTSSARFNLLKDIVQGRPTGGLFISNEELLGLPEDPDTEEGAPITNPLVNARTQIREDERSTLLFNGFLEYEIIDDLKLKVSGGIQKLNQRRESFDKVNSAFERRNGFTRGEIRNRERINKLFTSTLTFKKTILDNHNFTTLLGFDYQDITDETSAASGSVFPEPNLGIDNLGAATEAGFPFSVRVPTNRLISLFYRINYDYAGKYFLTGTIRRDGSSRFGANNKFGVFPSVSAAWRFSDESFLNDSNVISNGKLRFEWGEVGNNRIPAFVSTALLNTTTYGLENAIAAGVFPANLANPDIKWETQRQINLGLDLGLFNGNVSITADVYRKESDDLLLQAPTPANTGFTTVFRNIGKIRNEGIELGLNTVNVDKGVKWTTDFNITFPSNKTLSLVEDDILFSSSSWSTSTVSQDPYANDFITQVGQPFGLMYGYIDDGLYRAEDFDTNGDALINVSFGDEELGYRKYVDLNGDNIIDEDDKAVLGNPNPKFFGGLTNNFSYKGFDLSVFLQWSYGNDIYNANRALWTSGLNSHRNFVPEIINRWRDTNTDEQNAAATFRSINDNTEVLTSQYIEDGSYIRLKTVSLGYTFPKQLVEKLKIQKLRIYATGQNLVTWTDYTGYDPEVSTRGSGLTSGVDFGAYPRSRTIIGGLSVSF
ncbi:SusC/RagA family TonB-linked outer membrane protein [Flavivirga spongiicola]|uniref:TonB-dependent receptor n=1 Tax=Flavivirga spongiicola TaxID=421621 RepID=A0ABU7XWA0_9FLAO|nr:TonB-dependent receptor [Flavivirga sp. MEBiC05379]MDO5980037.1 TonB-dependent receptor [Flavivirga sp. MEBiC05379]